MNSFVWVQKNVSQGSIIHTYLTLCLSVQVKWILLYNLQWFNFTRGGFLFVWLCLFDLLNLVSFQLLIEWISIVWLFIPTLDRMDELSRYPRWRTNTLCSVIIMSHLHNIHLCISCMVWWGVCRAIMMIQNML